MNRKLFFLSAFISVSVCAQTIDTIKTVSVNSDSTDVSFVEIPEMFYKQQSIAELRSQAGGPCSVGQIPIEGGVSPSGAKTYTIHLNIYMDRFTDRTI